MRIPSDRTRRDMELAAELRAAGAPWEVVAEKLGRQRFVMHRWGKLYPDIWERLLREAEERYGREGNNESHVELRRMLRHKSSRVRLAAADKLTKLRLAELDRQASLDPREDLNSFLAHADEISDEELYQYLCEFIEELRSGDHPSGFRLEPRPAQADDRAVESPEGAD
jgi:hypothetical protein